MIPTERTTKPLGIRAYGSIGHLPNSRLGPGDHRITDGQARIATVKTRDKHDRVIVQEKLDGSCVAVARIDGEIVPLGRAGYPAISSPYEQHRLFHNWAWEERDRFLSVLHDGERLVGEWLAQAHGTRYDLSDREPFVAFDIMAGTVRLPWEAFFVRIVNGRNPPFATPQVIAFSPITAEAAMDLLGSIGGFYGAIDPVEGAVWRVERKGRVDFLCKYVRPDKADGTYLPDVSGKEAVWNWRP